MRFPRFMRASGATAPPAGDPSPEAPPQEPPEAADRRARRRAFAQEQGWSFAERDQRVLLGWPRTALPPGPLGRVRNSVAGYHGGRPFKVFDYEPADAPPLVVYTVGLPSHVPYVYVQERGTGGETDLHAEARDRRYALALLGDALCAAMRDGGVDDLVLDRDRLISTGTSHSPSALLARLDVLTELVGHVPDEVWTEWGTAP